MNYYVVFLLLVLSVQILLFSKMNRNISAREIRLTLDFDANSVLVKNLHDPKKLLVSATSENSLVTVQLNSEYLETKAFLTSGNGTAVVFNKMPLSFSIKALPILPELYATVPSAKSYNFPASLQLYPKDPSITIIRKNPSSTLYVPFTPLNKNILFDLSGFSNTKFNSVNHLNTVFFRYTGSNQFFKVPPGNNEIIVTIWGAAGGGGDSISGGGAFVKGKLPVTPGQVLTVIVGEGGTEYGDRVTFGGGGTSRGDGGPYRGLNTGSGGGRSAIGMFLNVSVVSALSSGLTFTYCTSKPHNLTIGMGVVISGMKVSGYNSKGIIVSATETSFTIANSTGLQDALSENGSVYLEMVNAAGGGGSYGGGSGAAGAGGLNDGQNSNRNNFTLSIGATQTSPGYNDASADIANKTRGSFLQGGAGEVTGGNDGGGGGGGWFGGGGGSSTECGAGGSSYTSYPGFQLDSSSSGGDRMTPGGTSDPLYPDNASEPKFGGNLYIDRNITAWGNYTCPGGHGYIAISCKNILIEGSTKNSLTIQSTFIGEEDDTGYFIPQYSSPIERGTMDVHVSF